MRTLEHAVALIALLTIGCRSARIREIGDVERSLDGSERTQERADALYDLTDRDMIFMRAMAADVMDRSQRAARDLESAILAYHQAVAFHGEAAAAYGEAGQRYCAAAEAYRQVAITLIAAAASDLFLRGVCGKPVSTRQYRQALRAQGVDLDGKDIDHIIPRSQGGPDLPWNYNPLDSSINRGLQANGMLWKLGNYPIETLNAWATFASYLLSC